MLEELLQKARTAQVGEGGQKATVSVVRVDPSISKDVWRFILQFVYTGRLRGCSFTKEGAKRLELLGACCLYELPLPLLRFASALVLIPLRGWAARFPSLLVPPGAPGAAVPTPKKVDPAIADTALRAFRFAAGLQGPLGTQAQGVGWDDLAAEAHGAAPSLSADAQEVLLPLRELTGVVVLRAAAAFGRNDEGFNRVLGRAVQVVEEHHVRKSRAPGNPGVRSLRPPGPPGGMPGLGVAGGPTHPGGYR